MEDIDFWVDFVAGNSKQIAKIGFTLTPTAHTTLVFIEVWRCTNYAKWKPHWFQNWKKIWCRIQSCVPCLMSMGVLENQEEKQKEKANKGEE